MKTPLLSNDDLTTSKQKTIQELFCYEIQISIENKGRKKIKAAL